MEPAAIYVVDGNNVAHSWRLASDGRVDRDLVRRRVGEIVKRLGGRAVLVFDGPLRGRSVDGDAAVLRRATRLARGRSPVVVVTSDKPLLERARRVGARVLRAHEFRRARPSRPEGPLR